VSGAHQEHFTSDTVDAINSNAVVDLRIGRRTYRPVADKVVAQHTLGLSAGFNHLVNTSPFFGRTTQNGWQAGPYAELGGVYLITPHFGSGRRGPFAVLYGRGWGQGPTGAKTHTWVLGVNTAISFFGDAVLLAPVDAAAPLDPCGLHATPSGS